MSYQYNVHTKTSADPSHSRVGAMYKVGKVTWGHIWETDECTSKRRRVPNIPHIWILGVSLTRLRISAHVHWELRRSTSSTPCRGESVLVEEDHPRCIEKWSMSTYCSTNTWRKGLQKFIVPWWWYWTKHTPFNNNIIMLWDSLRLNHAMFIHVTFQWVIKLIKTRSLDQC